MPQWKYDYEKYQRHLKSEYWKVRVHEAVKARCRRTHGRICCERCEAEDRVLQKHHLIYDFLYHELDNLGSVIWLCVDCHQFLHGRIKADPAESPSWTELEERIRRL